MHDSTRPILPRHRVSVLVLDEGDGARFVRLFRATWRRLPLRVRRRILRHWRSRLPAAPTIELLPDWLSGRDMGALVTLSGHLLQFLGPVIDRMPDAIACDLIAHELAHVDQWASGAMPELLKVEHGQVLTDEFVEADADETMAGWGFDPESRDRWAAKNRRWLQRLLQEDR